MNRLINILLLVFTTNCSAQTFTYDTQSRLTAIDYADGKRIEYSYDKLGNRIGEKIFSPYCNTLLTGFSTAGTTGIKYQWQVNSGSGFNNITDGPFYFGSIQDSLIIKNPPTNYAFNKYRCVITTAGGILYSDTYQLRIKATWTGNSDTAWANSANWECSLAPDEFVDVTIPSGISRYPVVSSNANVYSLTAKEGASIVIKTGVAFEVKGK